MNLQRCIDDIRSLFLGATEAWGELPLSTDGVTTTTTVQCRPVSANSVIVPFALDAGAAGSEGIRSLRFVCSKGSFVIHHPASAVSREIRFVIMTPRVLGR